MNLPKVPKRKASVTILDEVNGKKNYIHATDIRGQHLSQTVKKKKKKKKSLPWWPKGPASYKTSRAATTGSMGKMSTYLWVLH